MCPESFSSLLSFLRQKGILTWLEQATLDCPPKTSPLLLAWMCFSFVNGRCELAPIMAKDRRFIKLGEIYAKLSSTCCFEMKKLMRNCISQFCLSCCRSFKCQILQKVICFFARSKLLGKIMSNFLLSDQNSRGQEVSSLNLTPSQVSKLQFNQRT